jgi:hypothetical protein
MDVLHNIHMTKTAKGQENLMPETNNVLTSGPALFHTHQPLLSHYPPFFSLSKAAPTNKFLSFWGKRNMNRLGFLYH